jgi:glucose-1-phosphate thymidylyltransferase
MISCPEEIAYRMGYIGEEMLREQAKAMNTNQYGAYLLDLLNEKDHTGAVEMI